MKIAIVSSGSSIHVKKIANELVKRGHDLTLYTMPNHMKLIDDFDKKISIVKLPVKAPFGYYLNSLVLRKMLKSENYDLINSHYASGYGTLVRLANVHPLSLAVFGSDVFEYPYKSKANMRTLIRNLDNADVITSTSNIMAAELRKFYHGNKKIYITPFGVDLSIFHSKKPKEGKPFVFGTVKKIEKIYGIDILIRAFSELLQCVNDDEIELHIYGRGSAIDEYKSLCNELSIQDKVLFKGFVPNEQVPMAYSDMDVACFASVVDESFGVAVVEAMACGVPVIASKVAGFEEVMGNGKVGILVKKGSVEELKNAMLKMYAMDKKELSLIREEGVKRVHQYYDFSKNMDTYVEALLNACEK